MNICDKFSPETKYDMRRLTIDTRFSGVEWGAIITEDYKLDKITRGTRYGVKVPAGGIGSFHSHGPFKPKPSAIDLATMLLYDHDHMCIGSTSLVHGVQVRCWSAKKGKEWEKAREYVIMLGAKIRDFNKLLSERYKGLRAFELRRSMKSEEHERRVELERERFKLVSRLEPLIDTLLQDCII